MSEIKQIIDFLTFKALRGIHIDVRLVWNPSESHCKSSQTNFVQSASVFVQMDSCRKPTPNHAHYRLRCVFISIERK